MEKIKLDYVGKIAIKSVRDFILDNNLTERDAVLLNPRNYDDLVLEFRETYKDSLKAPYFIFDTLIAEDQSKEIPLDRIGLTTNVNNLRPENKKFDRLDMNEVVYRCGWCGNIVDQDGGELNQLTFKRKMKILEAYGVEAFVKKVTGYCCRNLQH